jgi:hypothetical protein
MNTTTKFLKNITKLAIAIGLLLPAVVQAQDRYTVATIAPNTPLTVLTGGKYLIKDLLYTSTNTTTAGTFWFYDSSGDDTNYVTQAYTAIGTPYSTNYNNVFTNASGILITNIIAGIYTPITSVLASTNERPKILGPVAVGVNTYTSLPDVMMMPRIGLTVRSTVGGTVQVTYKQLTP